MARVKAKRVELQAEERHRWCQWQDDKRLLWIEMLRDIGRKQKKLELEVTVDNGLSRFIIAGYLKTKN